RIELARARIAVGTERGETADPFGFTTQAVGRLVGGAHAGFVGGHVASGGRAAAPFGAGGRDEASAKCLPMQIALLAHPGQIALTRDLASPLEGVDVAREPVEARRGRDLALGDLASI